MHEVDILRDGHWEKLIISESEVEDRKTKYFAKLEKLYPNLESITPEEYERLVAEYNNGNQEIINELIQKTFIYIFRPIVSVFSRYSIKAFDFEDALNEGILTYSRLIGEHQIDFPETKSEFITYICRIIIKMIQREDQRIKRHNVQLCLDCKHVDYSFQLEDDPQFDLMDDKLFKEDIVKIILSVYDELKNTDKFVFDYIFKQNNKEVDAAKFLNFSREGINQSKKRIRSLILRKLAYELRYIPKEYEFGGINPYND